MRLLGLDVGSRTIGAAISDDDGVVATPLRTLRRSGGQRDLEAVAALYAETGAQGLVVGLPLSMNGDEGAAARRVRVLGDALAVHLRCTISYEDERFTTVQAERVLIDADVSRRRRKQVVDHVAAALILQAYLDRRAAEAVR